MLEESEYVRQVKGEPKRRWFSDDYFDLIVWVDCAMTRRAIHGF